MPSCFALYDKATGEQQALQDVDKKICEYLDVPVDEENWVQNWYNTVGLSLAVGHSFEKIREFFPEKEAVISFLQENYDVNSWKEWK